jgi:hypothetical protein
MRIDPMMGVAGARAGAGPRRAGATLLRRRMLRLALVAPVGGCYVYTPLASAPSTGSTVSFTLTDAGRLSLGRSIGEGARSLEGEVDSTTDSTYVLHVQSVTYINGQHNKWTGERLVVGRQQVTDARQRDFSKSRTALVAAATVGGLVAFIATRGLLGGGGETQRNPDGTPAGQ